MSRRQPALAATTVWSLNEALAHLRSFVSDLAGFAGKSAALRISAPPLMVPEPLIAAVVPALVRLLRNAVLNDIEPPMTRFMTGKPVTGQIALAVGLAESELRFWIADDGLGVGLAFRAMPEGDDEIAEARQRLSALGGRISMMIPRPGQGRCVLVALPAPAASGESQASELGGARASTAFTRSSKR